MKKILYVMASALILLSCEKEEIEPKIADQLVNYFEIKNDNPDDPIQCERYAIYEEYGVPVYFNDTIAKVFVKISERGDSIFRYERVDMNWDYSGSTVSTNRYSYVYYDTDAEKLKALEIIRNYLEKASEPLRPFCFFATKTASCVSINNGMELITPVTYFKIGYRAVLLQMFSKLNTPVKIDVMTSDLRKTMIITKINNFKRELEEFNVISDAKWYYQEYAKPVEEGGLGVVWDSSHMMMKYTSGKPTKLQKIVLNASVITSTRLKTDYPLETEETFESFRQNARAKMGVFGFVGTHKQVALYSYPTSQELDIFVTEILQTNREEFTRRWGTSPLVMKKYDILYKIIKEQMDIDLDAD